MPTSNLNTSPRSAHTRSAEDFTTANGNSNTLPTSTAPNDVRNDRTPNVATQANWRAGENFLNRVLPSRVQSMRQSGSAQALHAEQREQLSHKMADRLICRLTQQIDAFNLRWPEDDKNYPNAVTCQLQSTLTNSNHPRSQAFDTLVDNLSQQIKSEIEAFSSYNYSDGAHLSLLRTVLNRLKHYESTPKTPSIKGVFAKDYGEILRTALLCASSKLALPMESWEFAVKAPVTDSMRENPWPIIETFSNFTPEAQTRVHHAMMHFYLASNIVVANDF